MSKTQWKVETYQGAVDIIAADKAYVDDMGNLRLYNIGESFTRAQYAPKFWANFKLVSEN